MPHLFEVDRRTPQLNDPTRLLACLSLLINFNNMLGVIDFRNASYHGQILDNRPHGIGILIDSHLLFCLARWQHGQIHGPVFAVYPDHKIFCGFIERDALCSLSCFYLPDQIQTYIDNSDQRQSKSFITVLPAYKLIIEIDCSNEKEPKAKRHYNYQEEASGQDSQLTRVFGKRHDLKQFRNWKTFLLSNFIDQHSRILLWAETFQKEYCEYFLGFRHKGLGIKMIEFYRSDSNRLLAKNPVIVSSIGQFSSSQQLCGYGQQLVDRVLFKQFEQGEFFGKMKETVQYPYPHRPQQSFKLHQNHQKKSIYFRNVFINVSLLFKMQSVYSKVDVQVVEETKKIAQVILHNNQDSEMVVAQIQKKREKRKKSGLNKDRSQISQGQSSQLNFSGTTSHDRINLPLSQKLANPEVKLGDAQQSIYSSVEKVKREDPEKRIKAVERYQQLYMGKQDKLGVANHQRQPRVNHINESPSPKNGILEQRSKYNVETSNSRLSQSPLDRIKKQSSSKYFQHGNDIREAELALYRKMKDKNELKYLDLESSIHQSSYNDWQKQQRQQSPSRQYLYKRVPQELRAYENYTGLNVKPNYRDQAPFYKTLVKDEDYSIYYEKIKSKQQQLSTYNKILQESRENRCPVELNRTPLRANKNPSQRSASRVKSPGKIRTIKRQKQLEQSWY